MRAIWLERAGGPEELRLVELPDPAPGPGEVRVRLQAAALNRRDATMRRRPTSPFPYIPGSDGAGVVDQLGEGVADLALGAEVVILPSLGWPAGEAAPPPGFQILGGPTAGTYAEYIVVPRANVFSKPAGLSWAEAAGVPLAGLTAWRALFTRGRLRAGETVAVTGIGGGVATFGLLFARLAGATVYITSGSDEKLARAAALGAAGGVNYRSEPAWSRRLLEWTGGQGVDLVLDSAAGEVWAESLRALRPGGRLVTLGSSLAPICEVEARHVYMKQLDIRGTTMGSAIEFAQMLQPFHDGRLRPVVDRIFPLAEAAEAHRRMETQDQFGKIVLAIGPTVTG